MVLMSRTRAGVAHLSALMLTGVVIVGCAPRLEGTVARPDDVKSQPPSSSLAPVVKHAWLSSVLPSATELSSAVGYQVRAYGSPTLGDATRLRDTTAGSQSVTEGQCLGVVSPFEGRVYGGAPVTAVTYATESTITFGAVALATGNDARRLFETFLAQWQRCLGTKIVSSDGAYTTEAEIIDVDAVDDVVAAVELVTSNSPTGILVRSERALGVAGDCIVEAEVPVTDPESTAPSQEKNAAVAVVEAMLAKVRATRR